MGGEIKVIEDSNGEKVADQAEGKVGEILTNNKGGGKERGYTLRGEKILWNDPRMCSS